MARLLAIKRADKLIAHSVISSLAVVWVLLVGFDTFTHFARELGDLGDNYSLAQAAYYTALSVPRRTFEMFGHAALIGTLLGLGALAGNSELIALRAAGMSRARIAISAVLAVAALTLLVVVLGETLAPAGEQRAKALQLSLHSHKLGMTTRSGLWAKDGNSVINAKTTVANVVDGHEVVQLGDVRIYTFDDGGDLTKLAWAQSAIRKNGAWQLQNVRSTRFDADGAHSSTQAQQPWHTSLSPRLLKLSVIQPDYLALRDLRRNIRYFRANHQNPGDYVDAYWKRIFYPLNILLLVLVVIPFAFAALRSGGLGKRIFIGILLAICWYFVQMSLISIGAVYGVPWWLANLLPALLLVVVIAVLYRRSA
ncbi:MAG: LPS export ABC transporter permease LptG [Xanthomonadales bacterium]|nr:LPS export ABC transporter permease LptG [Xanthomonadales bacterium]